jgi:hypothetical protein
MAESAPNVGTSPRERRPLDFPQRISWPHRMVAILFADVSAALYFAISTIVVLKLGHSRASTGELLDFFFRRLPGVALMLLVVGAVPSIAMVWLVLRKSFPSLLVASLLGVLVGCCVCCVLTFVAVFAIFHLGPGVVLVGLMGGLPVALPAGAIGGAVAWCYLNYVHRRQSGLVRN